MVCMINSQWTMCELRQEAGGIFVLFRFFPEKAFIFRPALKSRGFVLYVITLYQIRRIEQRDVRFLKG